VTAYDGRRPDNCLVSRVSACGRALSLRRCNDFLVDTALAVIYYISGVNDLNSVSVMFLILRVLLTEGKSK
jgi:hypothetical protein